jgi:N-acetyl-gamma-glutamyl-phosphate reductase
VLRASIIGSAGYTGGELIRILLNHPECELKSVHSRSQAGKHVFEVHSDLLGETNLMFSNAYDLDADVIFLCMGHGESKKFIQEHKLSKDLRVVDLSQDFRYVKNIKDEFTYGLPEYNRLQIKKAAKVANPGCFATAIQLALLPLAKENLLREEIHISAITGSTGAGQSFSATTQFTWRASNTSLYKPFVHQHLWEIDQTLQQIQKKRVPAIRFLPFRGNFTRGILAAVYTKIDQDLGKIKKLYQDYYEPHPFIQLSESNPDIKQVVNTNRAIVSLQKRDAILLIVTVIDNLIKGASGQAVQNMNLMFGFDETCGLKLKPVGY